MTTSISKTIFRLSMLLQPVILSGGSGTRLWPLSREKHPKQLHVLFGQQSMLQATASRMRTFPGTVAAEPLIVCNEEYRFVTAEQLRAAGYTKPTILLEPAGRNTAPALTLASLAATAGGDDPLLLVMPADHVIAETEVFHQAIQRGIVSAAAGAMVCFGIVPDRAETGYGYIHVGQPLAHDSVRELLDFAEKPASDLASHYLASGDYLWNSGIFLLRASVWLRAISHFNPAMLASCERAMQAAKIDYDFVRVDSAAFLACPADSIDYAVMEKLPVTPELQIPACVIPLDAGWSDVGAWDAVWQVSAKDQDGNAAQGDVMLEDSRNCLVLSGSRLVTCLGLDDAVVIETADAVLVTNKQHTQEIKRIVARLKAANYPQTEHHRKVYRPWGHYDAVDGGAQFQVKRIVVKPGGRLSMQMHQHRAEHWVVVSGSALVTRGMDMMTLHENQSTYIPQGVRHRLENTGSVDLELIEVQSGDYLGEDDIVRFDDIYGRE